MTNYIELYNPVYGAGVGCSKNERNCSKKVTYGRIPRDTMHMKAIQGRGYHRIPCSSNLQKIMMTMILTWMIKRTGVMGSCDPESLRRCLRQPSFRTRSSPAEKLISQTEPTFTLQFLCLLSFASPPSGILQKLITLSLENFKTPPWVPLSFWERLLSLFVPDI